jgi:(R,R)-butanediol dehydrogenase/meso-butanediol dehydrogenase/diacetyl reductase
VRAAVVTPAHGFEVVDLPDPTPGPADMVLRVEACGICGSDLMAVGLHTVAAARIRPGDRVLVLGGGNVGAAVTVWARRLGAIEVVVSDPAPGRRDSAGLFGATDVHDPTEGAAPTGFDVVVECVGIPGMIDAAVAAVAPLGRVVVAGVCATPDQITPLATVLKEVEMAFVVYYGKKEFAAAADLLLSGGIDAGAFITRRAGLEGVGQAFTDLLGGAEEVKILITPNEPTRQPEPTDATKDV